MTITTYSTQPRHAIARAASPGRNASENTSARAQRAGYAFVSCILHKVVVNNVDETHDVPRRLGAITGNGATALSLLALTTSNPSKQIFMIEAILTYLFDAVDIEFEWSPIVAEELAHNFKVWFSVAAQRFYGGAYQESILPMLCGSDWPLQFANPFVGVMTSEGFEVCQLADYYQGRYKGFHAPIALTRSQVRVVRANTIRANAMGAGLSAEEISCILFDENCTHLASEEDLVEPQSGVEEQAAGDFIRRFFNGADADENVGGLNVLDTMRLFMERILPRIHVIHKHSFDSAGVPSYIPWLADFFLDPAMIKLRITVSLVGMVAWLGGRRKTAAACYTILTAFHAKDGNMVAGGLTGLVALWNLFKSDLWEPELTQPQGFEAVVSTALVAKVIGTVFQGASELSIATISARLEKELMTFQRKHAGAQEFLQTATTVIVSFFGWLSKKTGLEWLKAETNDPYWVVTEYLDRVDEIRSEYDRNPQVGPNFDARLQVIQQDGKQVHQVLSSKSTGFNIAQAARVNMALRQIVDMRMKIARSMNANSAMKPVPVAVTLTGAPGIGKTVFTHLMWPRLLPAVMSKEQVLQALGSDNVASYIYPLNPSDQYMSGYNGQVVCLIDELGAAKDAPGNGNIWLEMIRLINMAPTQLNMAELENKGRQWFTSRFLVCTSNLKHFGNAILEGSVREAAAVHRRMEHTYIVGLKPEYRSAETRDLPSPFDWLPDKTKMAQLAAGSKVIGWSHIQMYKMLDVSQGTFDITKPLSPDEVISALKAAAQVAEADRDRIVEAQRLALAEEARIMGVTKERAIDDEAAAALLAELGVEPEVPGGYKTPTPQSHSEVEEIECDPPPKRKEEAKGEPPSKSQDYMLSAAKVAAVAAAVGPFIYLATRLVGRLFSEDSATQAYGPRNKVSKLDLSAKRATTAVQAGGLAMRQTADSVTGHNVYEVIVKAKDADGGIKEFRQGQCLAVCNGVALVPDHFIAQWRNITSSTENGHCDQDAVVEFHSRLRENRSAQTFAPVIVKASARALSVDGGAVEVSPGDGADLVAIFVRGLGSRDIVGRIKDAAQVQSSVAHKGYRVLMRKSLVTVEPVKFERKDGGKMTDTTKDLIANSYLEYRASCGNGDCGAPIMSEFDNCVVGIHSAGTSSAGYAPVIEVEKLRKAIAYLRERAEAPEDLGFQALPPEHLALFKAGDVSTRQAGVGIGRVKPMAMATKTKIMPSPIHGLLPWGPRTRPAMLRPTGAIDPMDNATWGYGLGGSYFPEWAFQAGLDSYLSLLSSCEPPLKGRQRSLTFEEAVQGIPDDEFAGPIDRSKSAGFPWAYTPRFKRLAFGEEEWTFQTREAQAVKRVVEHDMALLRQGSRPFWLHQHFLKDERRTLAKVAGGQTRLISASPLHAVICTRMLCLNFSSWMMHNRVKNGFGVGCNAHSDDWGYIARSLGGDSDSFRVMCGDFKAWDKRLGAQTMRALGHAMDLFYGDHGSQEARARWTVIADLESSRHIDGSVVYEWCASNPSGNALTTTVNSVGNQVDTRAAFIIALVGKGVPLDVAKAAVSSSHFRVIVYGDDVAIAVRKGTVFDALDGTDVQQAFASVGLTYTDANKGGVAQFETIHEASFLKRTFRRSHYADKRWMAPLAWETIAESIQWCRDGRSTTEDWKRNLRSMALEAAAHGKDAYLEYVRAVQSALKTMPEPPVVHFPQWERAQDELLQTEYLL